MVLDCLLLIGSFSNLLINFLVNYCSPSTSHRTPLRSETVQRFTRTLAASPRPTGDHDDDHLRRRRVVVSAAATRELRRDVLQVREHGSGHDDLSLGHDRGGAVEVKCGLQTVTRQQHEPQQ